MNEATLANLKRKSAFVDRVQLHDGKPLPSWIDLSLTELCNRSAGSARPCSFCPRIDTALYPNQKLHMSLGLAGKIARELRELSYRGAVVLCGFGEPMLHPHIVKLVGLFEDIRVEIVTNGDQLTVERIEALRAAGLAHFVVSMYDGPQQRLRFIGMFKDAGLDDTDYSLRDRWHSEADDFGLKLTNRGGTVDTGHQPEIDETRVCHYLAYQLTVDWNGDVLLCAQDWTKRTRFGNLRDQPLLDVWNSPAMHKRRMRLLDGKRTDSPCSGCNTDGTLHGFNHVPHWRAKNAVFGSRHSQDRAGAGDLRSVAAHPGDGYLSGGVLCRDPEQSAAALEDAAAQPHDADAAYPAAPR